jgi:hypothetical protein
MKQIVKPIKNIETISTITIHIITITFCASIINNNSSLFSIFQINISGFAGLLGTVLKIQSNILIKMFMPKNQHVLVLTHEC